MTRVERSSPPPPGSRRRFRFPEFSRERLPNGVELVVAPLGGVPLVEAVLQLPAGGDRNPVDRPGLAALTATLIDEGTARRDGPTIAATIERLGGSLASRADWNGADVAFEVLARDLATALELAAEVARQPTFPAHEVERLRQQALAELLRRRDQPAVLAEEAQARALYPGTPYGALILGDEETMATLSRDDVAAFHGAFYGPSGASLVVAGEVDPGAARALAERLLGDWEGPAPRAPLEVRPAEGPTRRVVIVDRPEAAQTELRLAHAGVARPHPDRTRLGVLNALLGGKFTSRLNLNLRERHGYTYGASSRFVDRRGPGPFVISAAVANEVAGAAVGEVLSELDRLRQEEVGDEELAETRDYLLGVFPYTLQTHSDVVGRLAELALWELPDDHYERALAQVAATTPEDLLALARRHLRPQSATVVAVGPAAALTAQLAGYGEVEVVRI